MPRKTATQSRNERAQQALADDAHAMEIGYAIQLIDAKKEALALDIYGDEIMAQAYKIREARNTEIREAGKGSRTDATREVWHPWLDAGWAGMKAAYLDDKVNGKVEEESLIDYVVANVQHPDGTFHTNSRTKITTDLSGTVKGAISKGVDKYGKKAVNLSLRFDANQASRK